MWNTYSTVVKNNVKEVVLMNNHHTIYVAANRFIYFLFNRNLKFRRCEKILQLTLFSIEFVSMLL